MQHRLSNINKETLTGDCQICGPVPLRYRPSRNQYECRIRQRQHLKKHKAKIRGMSVTEEQEQAAYIKQNGMCAICSVDISEKYCRDHDHITGEFRGLLCSPCNLGLGNFRDDVERLRAAIKYLESFV